MRPVAFTRGFLDHPAGSCLVEFGKTRVLCTVSVEDDVPPWLRGKGRGWLTAEYAMLPGSTGGGRKRREIGKRDGRSVEIQRLIGRSLRAAVDLDQLGETTLMVDCDVLQADGGTRTAAITGSWVALHHALSTLVRFGAVKSMPLTDHVAAISCGLYRGEPVLDLDYAEDSDCQADANFVLTGRGGIVEIQATAETDPFEEAQFDILLKLARKGIGELTVLQKAAVA